jgi:hypothetical protein
MWSGATESEAHLQGSERRRQKRTPTPWQLPALRDEEGTTEIGSRQNAGEQRANTDRGEEQGKMRRVNGAEERARKAF